MATYSMHFACFHCRRSFKRSVNVHAEDFVKRCPHCGGNAINLGRHFKPPKISDLDQWKNVQFLVAAGFFFQHVKKGTGLVRYPKTLDDARDFVERYRSQAWTERIPEALEILAQT